MIDYRKLSLWPHQLPAIADAEAYLNDTDFTENYLVKAPTGSGKTGIMAVLSRILFVKKNILILIPSIALREQLITQLEKDFWEDPRKLKIKASDLEPKMIVELLPKKMRGIRQQFDKDEEEGKVVYYIFVAVINTLHILKNGDKGDYAFIREKTDFVFFDEGHKEPAYSWAKAVRDLHKKTILFSATPYRNDLKLFNINKKPGKYHFLGHAEAIAANIVRDIQFRAMEGDTRDLMELILQLLPCLETDRQSLSTGDLAAKVVIRCDSQARVERMVNILIDEKKAVLGLHENFGDTPERKRIVPLEEELKAYDFIVHQNKLIEGVDNPNFLILVLLDDFPNERSLIQQLGRMIRNLTQKPQKKAIVYYWKAAVHKPLEEIWQTFLDFDAALKAKGLYDIFDLIQVNKKIELIYQNNAIRPVREASDMNLSEIYIPKRTTVRELRAGTDLTADDLFEIVSDELGKQDAMVVADFALDDNGYLIIHHGMSMSPYFSVATIMDSKHEIIVFFIKGNYIYYLDTSGKLPDYLLENSSPLDPEYMLSMVSSGRRFSSVSVINSDLGKNTLRRRVFSGFSLKDVAPLLNDHNYIPTTVSANTKGFTDDYFLQRYIGTKTGKISEYTDDYCDLDTYKQWIKNIGEFLTKTPSVDNYYRRYARKIATPADTRPVNILIDLLNDDPRAFNVKNVGAYSWLDIASEIGEFGDFKISIESDTDGLIHTYDAIVKYDRTKKKYILESTDIDEAFLSREDDQRLVSELNKSQSFRIVTASNAAFYVSGAFYQPRLNLRKHRDDLDILGLLIPVSDLGGITSEKGDVKDFPPSCDTWHEKTVFGFIDRMGAGYQDQKAIQPHFNFTHLVCDDLLNEIGDFIGLDTLNKRIVILHGKAKTSKLSTSNFHDLCGQATKKLDILSPFFEKKPEMNINRFDASWSVAGVGTISKRIRHGNVNGKQFWALYEELVRNPQTTKEVYLVTGGMLSKSTLQDELNKKEIAEVRAETIDIIYLLRSTWSSVSSLGATLKVFCY